MIIFINYIMMNLIIEAIVVGVVMVIIGVGVSMITTYLNIPGQFNIFLTGFIGHLLFEMMGANKWYCTNGYACKTR